MSIFKKSASLDEALLQLLRQNLPPGSRKRDLRADTSLSDLGLDSLGILLVISEFCAHWSVDPNTVDPSVELPRTVGELVQAGLAILAAKGSS
jgi:hypothetical protein